MKRLVSNMVDWVSEENIRKQINIFKRLLWVITCVDMDLLARCPESEHKKYSALGAAMLISTILAFFSGYIALDYVLPELGTSGFFSALGKLVISLFLSLIWTLIIFNLQRFIVSGSSRTSDSDRAGLDEVIRTIPALIVSVIVGIAIALPLEIFLFKPEINLYLSLRSEQNRLDREESADMSMYRDLLHDCSEHYRQLLSDTQPPKPCMSRLQPAAPADSTASVTAPSKEGENAVVKPADATAAAKVAPESAPATPVAPATVSSDTDSVDTGAAAKEDKLRAKTELDRSLRDHLEELEARRAREKEIAALGGGLITRISALFEASPYFAYSVLLIVLFIQLTPVLIKIMAPKSPYEYLSEIWNRVVLAYGGTSHDPDLDWGGIEPDAVAVYDENGLGVPVPIYHRAEQVIRASTAHYGDRKAELQSVRVDDAKARMRRLEKLSRSD
jgi:hypothetical protein